MKKPLTLITIAIISIALVISCSKYEENKGISLKTKKARLCRVWQSQDTDYNATWEFTKENKFIIINYDEDPLFQKKEYNWEFSKNKEIIEIDWDWYAYTYKTDSDGFYVGDINGNLIKEDSTLIDEPDLTIIKLTSKDLIVEFIDSYLNEKFRSEFVKK